MIFNEHSELKGKHALLSPSQPYWLNYEKDDLERLYLNYYAQSMGTSLHELSQELIDERLKLRKGDQNVLLHHLLSKGYPRKTIDANMDRYFVNLRQYVNDAIGFRMTTEQPLIFSDNCFGTADSITFRDNTLRIHDLKTGKTPAKIEQLMIYAALFCFEYNVKPIDISIELCIYQDGEILYHNPEPQEITDIMHTIIEAASFLEKVRTH